jgi:hypothetical protein
MIGQGGLLLVGFNFAFNKKTNGQNPLLKQGLVHWGLSRTSP